MQTISPESKTRVTIEESFAIAIGFPTTDNTIVKGDSVKLNADGSVAKISAATDFPLGHVSSSWKGNDAGNVRVVTPFVAVIETGVKADGAVTAGQLLSVTGYDADANQEVATATAGYAFAVALSSAADGADVKIGVLRVPIAVAAP